MSIADQLGHYVGGLHQNRSTGFGGVELEEKDRRSSWADFWLPRFDKVIEEVSHEDVLPRAFLDEVLAIRRILPELLEIGTESTLTHYDIWSGNIMVNPNDSSAPISGFIDIPGHWADYARELSFMEMFAMADERFYAVYRSYQTMDDTFTARKNVYNLKMHIKHISMYPDQSYYRQGARECLAYLQRYSS